MPHEGDEATAPKISPRSIPAANLDSLVNADIRRHENQFKKKKKVSVLFDHHKLLRKIK